VIWVWTTKAASTGVSVQAQVASAHDIGSPKFTVCPSASGTTCKVGSIPVGQADELQSTVAVKSQATAGEHVRISAKATASGADSFTGSAADVVVASSATSTTAPDPSSVTLPAPATLPPLTGTGVSPSDPAGLFPTVGASPGASPGSLGLPTARPRPNVHAGDASAAVPLDSRLIGGQLAGLAVLAGAVTIAIARLSLRTPKPRHGGAAKGSNPNGSSSGSSDSADGGPKKPPQQG
jgi:hypothetical protein